MDFRDRAPIGLSLILAAQHSLEELCKSIRHRAFIPTPLILTQPPSLRRLRMIAIHDRLAQLDVMRREVDELGEWYEQLRTRLQRQHAIYTSALAPITALPHELLHKIF